MRVDENVPYHACRLLILIFICGRKSPVTKTGHAVKGRTLLAKLDFFVRYPQYLQKAGTILEKPLKEAVAYEVERQRTTVESRMIRYRYGPWDHAYYTVLGYMLAKSLIVLEQHNGVDVFCLTEAGVKSARSLVASGSFDDTALYSEATASLFRMYNGAGLKKFIYDNFPDVVNRPVGQTI